MITITIPSIEDIWIASPLWAKTLYIAALPAALYLIYRLQLLGCQTFRTRTAP